MRALSPVAWQSWRRCCGIRQHRRLTYRIWGTNICERISDETKRHTRDVRISTNDSWIERNVTAVLESRTSTASTMAGTCSSLKG